MLHKLAHTSTSKERSRADLGEQAMQKCEHTTAVAQEQRLDASAKGGLSEMRL